MGSGDASAGDLRKSFPLPTVSNRSRRRLSFHRILEMQVIATALIENFEFSLPPQNEKTRIYRKPSGLMIPMAEAGLGAWMGLIVKPID